MAYKRRFRPLEALEGWRWRELEPEKAGVSFENDPLA
jgi:arginyl-tRNA--protein-N-Asp/Glu arginylyltransferase